MSNCIKCGTTCKKTVLGGEDGVLIYKYYAENDTVEHYARYELCCEECPDCGELSAPELCAKAEGGNLTSLVTILDGEGYKYEVCPECGGRLIRDMAGMGSAGNLLKKFAEKEFPYSFALFDLCADCGRISDVHEKLMGV
ncbi:hypothetical protein [Ruminococcus albus]|uniref:Uncharacterized protein n=1 Tax=Ruminococcus albus TaxID=1264 RepID=A0A1H7KF20_RUMAL|nr:hypothetical protein [Ruminococcus albus]SEK85451.1 hypothetical protein SAMN05216469_106199 [Ruminococcus albus]